MKDLLISLVLICSIIFPSWNKTEAAIQGWVPPEDYGKGDSVEMIIDPSDDNGDQELQKMSPGVLSEQIYNVYKQVTPDIVITFGPKGFSDHTDHIETHKAATSAFNLYKKENKDIKLFYLAANRDFVKKFNMILSEIEKSPTHNVDITLELKEKISALKMYKSQKDAQDLSEMFLALYKEFGAIESFVQIYPKISVAKNKKIRTSTSILN